MDLSNASNEELNSILSNATSLEEVAEESSQDATNEVDLPIDEDVEKEVSQDEESDSTVSGFEGSVETAGDDSGEATEEVTDEESVDEYKAFYDKLANGLVIDGKQIKVNSPDELLSIINNRTTSQQPKANGKARVLDELFGERSAEDIGLILDVLDKKPEAIKKLLDASGISEFDLPDDVSGYQPRSIDLNKDYTLEDTLAELSADDFGNKAIGVVVNEWDSASQQAFANNPAELRALRQHMQDGLYDQIAAEVAKQKVLGNIRGMSDYQAYMAVGNWMGSNGLLQMPAHMQQEKKPAATIQAVAKQAKQANPAKVAVPKGKAKAADDVPDFSAMSNEELTKFIRSQTTVI